MRFSAFGGYHYEVCVCLTVVTSLFSFIPLLFDHNTLNGDHLVAPDHLKNWSLFNVSLIAAFSTALPMILDTLLDFRLPLRDVSPRYLIVISLILPCIINFWTYAISGEFCSIRNIFAALHMRETLLRGSLLSFLLYDSCSWKTLAAACSIFSANTFSLQMLLWSTFRPDDVSAVWRLCGRVTTAVTVLWVTWLLIHRWRKLLKKGTRNVAYVSILYPALYVLNITIKYILLSSTRNIAYAGFADVVVSILATTIPGRQARYEKAIAEHVIESKRDYVSYMSHEIRTPLNVVYMGIQLLVNECKGGIYNSEVICGILDDIDTSCKVAIDILNELLLANKLEAGNVTLEKELVSAVSLIKSVADPFKVQARQKGVTFLHDGDTHIDPAVVDDNIHLNVDPRKISQVLRNLISNALKFTPKNGKVDVYVYLKQMSSVNSSTRSSFAILNKVQPLGTAVDGRNLSWDRKTNIGHSNLYDVENTVLRIEVHDTGVGISQDDQQKLFGQIVQFNAAQLQNGGGSGIGLWISKKIMDLHGGRIGVKSEPGKGSMFFIELDVTTRHRSTGECDVHEFGSHCCQDSCGSLDDGAHCSVDSENCRVLIVDDSPMNRKMLTHIIEPKVGPISHAENGVEAVEKVRESMENGLPYDLIFMDSNMPELCGADATKLIRDMGYGGMIVFLTGNVMPDDIDRFISSGANDVLVKPCTLRSVEKYIATIRM